MDRRIATIFLVAVSLLSISIIPTIRGQETVSLEKEALPPVIGHRIGFGRTDALGGGSYLRMDLEAGSSLMVIWGDRENPAPITVISHGVDIIGIEDLDNGSHRAIKSDTLIFYRLTGIREFQDLNGNGFHDQYTERTDVSLARSEPIEKGCSLSGVWDLKKDRPIIKDGILWWTFSLHAWNISYRSFEENAADSVNATRPTRVMFLDHVSFTFTVKITKDEGTLDFRKIDTRDTANTEGDPEKESVKGESIRVNTSIKMGQNIQGWDIEKDSTNPSLEMLFNLKFLRTLNDPTVTGSIDRASAQTLTDYLLTGKAEGSEPTILWREGSDVEGGVRTYSSVNGKMELGSDRTKVLSFNWVGKATDEKAKERIWSNLQLRKMERIETGDILWANPLFSSRTGVGLSIYGSFIYPATGSIAHDPEFITTSVLPINEIGDDPVDDDDDVAPDSRGLTRIESISIVLVVAVVLLLIIVSIIASLSRRKYDPEEEELMREEEEEVFVVRTKKRDWDRLRPK